MVCTVAEGIQQLICKCLDLSFNYNQISKNVVALSDFRMVLPLNLVFLQDWLQATKILSVFCPKRAIYRAFELQFPGVFLRRNMVWQIQQFLLPEYVLLWELIQHFVERKYLSMADWSVRVNEPGKPKTRSLFQFYSRICCALMSLLHTILIFIFLCKRICGAEFVSFYLRVKKVFKYQCWDILP